AETREPVWLMEEVDTDSRGRSSVLRELEDHMTLPAGEYEAYFYVGHRSSWSGSISIGEIDDLEDFFEELGDKLGELGDELEIHLSDIFEDDDYDDRNDDNSRDDSERRRRLREKWSNGAKKIFSIGEGGSLSKKELRALKMSISADAKTFKTKTSKETSAFSRDSNLDIVNFTKISDDERLKQGFSLKHETVIAVYAQGEYSGSGNIFVDRGWIINADTGEKVWGMDKWSTRYAGGAKKNRYSNDTITLPAGNYVAFYMSDDSHSAEEWNAPPPHDPLNYGLRLSVKSASDRSSIGEFTYDPDKNVIFALDKARNNEYLTQGFTLTKETRLRILCYGEFAFNSFADYGWIEDIATMEPVWEMTEDNTDYGGGATKNRVFDNVIKLPAGDYMAGYVSDGSHAYRSWNSAKPSDPTKWGLTVYGVGSKSDFSSVKLFDEAPVGSGVLVSLTRVGDDEEVSDHFSLDKKTRVTISALGEGMNGNMYDYGWVENANSGEVVWKMRYRKTRSAGGADKNRMVTATVTLEAGDYDVIFVTDGSHSFQRFNARQPRNPQRWGIIVSAK
ncbi:hypothetical protein JYU19_02560, partial [bacterium AH-315-J21]|nr:hypothetical protein [bacterium AH-315-J21]